MSTQLTVSTAELSCNILLRQLKNMHIDANVIEGKSLVENKYETSCQITFAKKLGEESMKPVLKDTWDELKKKHHLTCGHLNIAGKYSGCVLDYLEPTKCKGPSEPLKNNSYIFKMWS